MNSLNAPAEVAAWFSEARLRLPNSVHTEIQAANSDQFLNRAGLDIFSGKVIATLVVFGTGYANRKGDLYGEIEYIVMDKRLPLNQALRCRDLFVENVTELIKKLDELLDDVIAIVSERDGPL